MASAFGSIVRLRPLEDPEMDKIMFSLFSVKIPYDTMKIVRFLYNVQCVVGDHFASHDQRDIEKYIIICYASWAYTKCFLRKRALAKIDMNDTIDSLVNEYKSAFSLRTFLRRYGELNWNVCNVRLTNYIQADYIARTMILDSTSMFGRIVLSTVKIDNVQEVFHRMTDFIKGNFHVFPTNCLGVKRAHKKGEIVKAQNWTVVKCGEYIDIPGEGLLTISMVREAMRRARLTEKRKHGRLRFRRLLDSSSDTSDVGGSKDTSVQIPKHLLQAVKRPRLTLAETFEYPTISSTIPSSVFRPEDAISREILKSVDSNKPSMIREAIPGTSKDTTVPFIEHLEPLSETDSKTRKKETKRSDKKRKTSVTVGLRIPVPSRTLKRSTRIREQKKKEAEKDANTSSVSFRKTRSMARINKEVEEKTMEENAISVSSNIKSSKRSKTSGKSSKSNKQKSKIVVKDVVTLREEQDLAILRQAIESCNVTSPRVWSDLRRNRLDMFQNVTHTLLKQRAFQLARGLGGRTFNKENKDKLKMLRELIRSK